MPWRAGATVYLRACIHPVRDRALGASMHYCAPAVRKLLLAEFTIRSSGTPGGLNGSGMLLANPPWQLDTELPAVLTELHALLAPAAACA